MINRYKKGKYAKMLIKVLEATFYFGHRIICSFNNSKVK